MGLLNRSTEVVTVFPEVLVIDADGNKITKPSAVGTVCKAVIQPVITMERADDAGFSTSEQLRMRLVGWEGPELGAQAAVEWEGRRYGVFGEPKRFRGSARTAHTDYYLIRK